MYLFKIFGIQFNLLLFISFIAKGQRHSNPSTFLENKALFDE